MPSRHRLRRAAAGEWKKRPEKMSELLDMLKRLAQTQDYSKHNSQCVTEDTEDAAGDTPKDTPPKND